MRPRSSAVLLTSVAQIRTTLGTQWTLTECLLGKSVNHLDGPSCRTALKTEVPGQCQVSPRGPRCMRRGRARGVESSRLVNAPASELGLTAAPASPLPRAAPSLLCPVSWCPWRGRVLAQGSPQEQGLQDRAECLGRMSPDWRLCPEAT